MTSTRNDTAPRTPDTEIAFEATNELHDHEEHPPLYTKREKWFIVVLSSLIGLFSPLTANLYFPAIPTLGRVFNKSTQLINLTVTMYMVMQSIAPLLFGTLSDQLGRRVIFVLCTFCLAVTSVGLALVPTHAYWLLLLLRCIQAAGSAPTIALGAGVIGDISEPHERGGFFGIYGLGPMFGPAIGPVIGGALAGGLGWRAIFWFLSIAAALCVLMTILFLPETLPRIVGDGTTSTLSRLHRPLIPIVGRQRPRRDPQEANIPAREIEKQKLTFKNPLLLFKHADILLILILNGVIVAIGFGVVASISSLFVKTYPFLDETEIGLCFLSVGGGLVFGSVCSGKLLDWNFQSTARRFGFGPESMQRNDLPPDFPIEQARLGILPPFMALFIACCCGYGWCVEKAVHLAGPLILLVGIGFVWIFAVNVSQTLTVDLVPQQSSSISACNNLIRGALGAALVAVIDLLLESIGAGWTYVLLGACCSLTIPLVYVVIKIGPRCRRKRAEAECPGR